ncbi:WXG100-like domain-containing protein [Nocardia brasiliensis]
MTAKLEVDPKVYYQAATNCFDAAAALNDSFKYVFGELNSCGHMAGRDEDGRAWGTSYDESARDAVAFFDQTFATLRAYGTALNDLGFEHAKSDAALKGTAQPDRPQDQASTVTFGPYALPASAAGGAPQGLLKASVEVLDAINCPLPDGNTDTLAKAADAWDRLGRIYQNTNAKDKITIAASLFDGVTSQDAVQVREDLKTLETSIGALLDTCKAISKTCLDYKESIEELRKEIKGFIDAIIQEAAIDMAITVIATCLTGVGGLIAGAKAVESARRWSIKIKAAVTAWRARKALQLKGLADDAKTVLAKGKQAVKDLNERLRVKRGNDVGVTSVQRPKALVDDKKFDYLFGRAADDPHNTPRSIQNLSQLNRVGVFDNPAGRDLLTRHFDEVVQTDNNIARTFSNKYGEFQVRESLLVGPNGILKFETTWQSTPEGLRLTTVIPKGGGA